jgi:transposase
MPPIDSILLDLPGFKILEVTDYSRLTLRVEYVEPASCPDCGSLKLRTKDSFLRKIRHVLIGQRPTWLVVKAHKYRCKACGRYFNERFPGVLKRARASEPFKNEVVKLHHNGWTQKALAQELKMGSATIERWYQKYFVIKDREFTGAHCPRVIGIDEHHFTRKDGFATTIADLGKHKVFDVVLGRSELSLRPFLRRLIGRENVRVVLMDLSECYRSIAKKYFPNALIVCDCCE